MTGYIVEVWDAVCASRALDVPFRTADGERVVRRHFPHHTQRGLTQAVDKAMHWAQEGGCAKRVNGRWVR